MITLIARFAFRDMQCYQFHRQLRRMVPGAEGYFDGEHVVTRIGDRYFDRTGDVTERVEVSGRFLPLWQAYGRDIVRNLFRARCLRIRRWRGSTDRPTP